MKSRAVIIVVVLLLATLVAGVVLERNAFRLHSVVVTGCQKRDPQEVVAASGLEYGESIFRIRKSTVKANIEKDPYFQINSISYLLPDGLHIDVTERDTYAVIYYMGAIVCMDQTGYILEVRQTLGDLQCPVITGLRMTAYQVGQLVQSSDTEQVAAMSRLLEALIKQDSLPLLSEIDISSLQSIKMVAADGYSVDFGDLTDIDTKIQWLRAVIPALEAKGYHGGTINVASGTTASYLPEGVSSWITPDVADPSAASQEPTDTDIPSATPLPGESIAPDASQPPEE